MLPHSDSRIDHLVSAVPQTITRICPQCGRVLQENWVSCPYCGKNVSITQQNPPISRALSTTSIIIGAISLIVFGVALGIVAMICGVIAVTRNDQRGYIGMVLGALGIILAIIIAILAFPLLGTLATPL